MGRTTRWVSAGAWVLLLVTGCASTDVAGLLLFQGAGDERVVAGSLDAVAQATRDHLQTRLHLEAELTKQGEAFHIGSVTPTGQRFNLILTRDKAGTTEKTRIRLEWVGDRNTDMTLQILGRLEHVTGQ